MQESIKGQYLGMSKNKGERYICVNFEIRMVFLLHGYSCPSSFLVPAEDGRRHWIVVSYHVCVPSQTCVLWRTTNALRY